MTAQPGNPFGRGRRGQIARELHTAFEQQGFSLLPGKAREIVDERVAAVAGLMGVSEPTALRALPQGWAQQQADDLAVEWGAATLAEKTTQGAAELSVEAVVKIARGLTVVLHHTVARTTGGDVPVGTGEPLDALSAMLDALADAAGEIRVDRATLLTAARYLGDLSDALRAGAELAGPDVDGRRNRVAARLARDAELARQAAY